MGTRADFYVGRDPETMEWVGSIAWDGDPDGLPKEVIGATEEQDYRQRVIAVLAEEDHATTPAQGWPWPWVDSGTTDYAYAFDGGKVYASCAGSAWFDPFHEPEEHDPTHKVSFPNMAMIQKVTFGKRSGLMIIGR